MQGLSFWALAVCSVGLLGCAKHDHTDWSTRPSIRACEEQTTFGVSVGFDPIWSPDDSTIAYIVSRRDSSQNIVRGLYRVQASGGPSHSLVQLTSYRDGIESKSWSPDGATIAYSLSNRAIMLVDVSSGAIRTLISNGRMVAWPAWCPDGRHLLYVRDRSNAEPDSLGGLYEYDCLSQTERPLLADGVRVLVPLGPIRFSPDGASMVFSMSPDGLVPAEVFWMNDDARGLRQITHLEGSALNPQWLTLRRIAFDVTPDHCNPNAATNRGTWIVNDDGSALHQWPVNLGDPTVQVGFPFAISASGNRVAFTSRDSTKTHGVIWTMGIDGSGRFQLSEP